LYQLCFNAVNGSGVSKGLEPYRYKRSQNELEIILCVHYKLTQNDYDRLTIEQFYKYLNEYYAEINRKKK